MMKKMIALLMALLLMGTTLSAAAEGLLPPISGLFETEMPNMEHALERAADQTQTLEDGSTCMTFLGIGQQGFDTCNVYLGSSGCAIASVSMDGGIMTAQLVKEGRTFSFVYDQATQTLVTTYPVGTYPEFFNPSYQPGKIICFGHYEQDGNTANGAEPIEWIVLAMEKDRVLLLSRYALEAMPYNTANAAVTWETSTLRKWLNADFLNTAFSTKEQAAILVTTVDNGRTQGSNIYRTTGGKNTADKLFLLSYKEGQTYLTKAKERQCVSTQHVRSQVFLTTDTITWWLRSPGSSSDCVMCYSATGSGVNSFCNVQTYAVRPALWLDISSLTGE